MTDGACGASPTLRFGAREVDLLTGSGGGGCPPLSPIERALLRRLAATPGEPVSSDDLLVEVWGYARAAASRTVTTTVARLRARLEPDPKNPRYLLTVHGQGYLLARDAIVRAPAPKLPGRDADLERVVRWLGGRDARWLSVIGPGGVGKSALLRAIGASTDVRRRFGGGVITMPAPERTGEPLIAALASPDTLVLVDWDDADPSAVAEALSDVLPRAAARVVAAARLPLDTWGEGVITLRPLPDDIVRSRLPAARPDVVAAIGGLPLALQLVSRFGPPPPGCDARSWLESLCDPDAPRRHQTLAANRRSTWASLGLPGAPADPAALGTLDVVARAGLLAWTADTPSILRPWMTEP